jgi:hypothetical protein
VATGPVIGGHRPSSLDLLRQTARQEIDRHVKCEGRCVICGTPFPCERALLAEMALGSF